MGEMRHNIGPGNLARGWSVRLYTNVKRVYDMKAIGAQIAIW
jgi:hypothetical protein